MKQETSDNNHLPIILMVRDGSQKTKLDSPVLAMFNIVDFSKSEGITILSWIQQNQPDLIILEIYSVDEPDADLLAPLKLDWLTRDIPIIVAGNRFALKSAANLDYDVCLNFPYSPGDLDRAVCSLINTPICQTLVS